MPDEFIDVGASTLFRIPDRDEVLTLSDDAYPGVYHDQRTMLPGGLGGTDPIAGESWDAIETAEQMHELWVRLMRQHYGQTPRPDEENRELVPYINASRWIALCPVCNIGIACWDRNPYACCLARGCGRIYAIKWQLPQARAEVMRVMAGWPAGNRNWNAHEDETVEELKIQSVLMAGVEVAERNALLVAENVRMPDSLTDVNEYLDRLRRQRRRAVQ